MNTSGKFAKIFINLLKEDSTAGGSLGGVQGFDPDGNINSSDFYAPGDARLPKGSKKVQTRNGTAKSKKKKKGIDGVFLTGEEDEENVEMCPDACCGKPVTECKCGPDCPHCDCYEKNNG